MSLHYKGENLYFHLYNGTIENLKFNSNKTIYSHKLKNILFLRKTRAFESLEE